VAVTYSLTVIEIRSKIINFPLTVTATKTEIILRLAIDSARTKTETKLLLSLNGLHTQWLGSYPRTGIRSKII